VSGVLNAGLSLSGTLDAPTGEGSALLQDLLVENLDEEEDALDVEISPQTLQLDFSLADRKLRLISSLLSDSDSSLQLDTTLGWPISDASAMSGMLAAQFDDFAAIEPLLFRYARITDPSGLITADLRLEGTLGEPDIRGTARLSEAAITIPATGIAVSDINLELSGQGNNPLQISGRAQSGGGNIAVTGTLDWKREIPQVNLLLNGNDFQLIRFPKQEVFVSPRLNIALTTDLISVDGQVTIPRADIEVIELPQTATQPSPDVVVIRERRIRQATSSGPDLKLDIEVILGDAVKLSAFGLDTGLKGSLRLKQRATDQRLLVEGNLRSIDGTFEAYGRELDIERGTLIFSGPVDEPLVDVRAIRSLRYEDKDIKVGVLLSGPLDRMQTRVFGEPAMSESDALSYLVLNRPLRRSNDVDSAELSTAAIALGLTNLIPGSKDLSTKIGLDEVGVESDTGGETSVIAGKRINDKFYIRYAYGLFDRIGRFVVRYDVGKGFSLEAGSGEEQTIDLLYSIDR
jgi:translocation and assembly module TamB